MCATMDYYRYLVYIKLRFSVAIVDIHIQSIIVTVTLLTIKQAVLFFLVKREGCDFFVLFYLTVVLVVLFV